MPVQPSLRAEAREGLLEVFVGGELGDGRRQYARDLVVAVAGHLGCLLLGEGGSRAVLPGEVRVRERRAGAPSERRLVLDTPGGLEALGGDNLRQVVVRPPDRDLVPQPALKRA